LRPAYTISALRRALIKEFRYWKAASALDGLAIETMNYTELPLLATTLWTLLASAAALVLYVYLGYPLGLALLGKWKARGSELSAEYAPSVSVVIPAYNEAKVILDKIENSLRLDYPRDRLEIVVASDGSTDGTNEVVREYGPRGVKLLACAPRAGKISVLNRAIPAAVGEIVLLCDANVMFQPNALKRLAAHFADPCVGAVTGDVRIRSSNAPFGEGEGLYYRYERFIQLQESNLGSTVTVDGGMYAIRKELFRPLPRDTILDDFVIGMNVALAGKRVLYDPSAVASENATLDVREEFRRKVRIVAGAFRELARGQGVPAPRHVQLFWSYISHKLLRWLVPWCLLVILACSLALAWQSDRHGLPMLLVAAQVAFYGAALLACTRPNGRWPAVIGIPFYFCMVNAAACVGSIRGLCGLEKVTWRKANR
jgi:cellulose synthase/poly-beta-1,6-N-acetylglucosamine synthase-like glycosyltransferase